MCRLFVAGIGCRRGMGTGWIKLYVFFGYPYCSLRELCVICAFMHWVLTISSWRWGSGLVDC